MKLHILACWLLVIPMCMAKDGYFTTSDGLRIHYVEEGQGSPVILIQGYSGRASNWFGESALRSGPHLGTALARRGYRAVGIDMRAHGENDKPLDPLKYGPQMAMDVVELMDHLGLQRGHVHGGSLGGVMVTFLLARVPERMITASYVGMGIPEVDPVWKSRVPKDVDFKDPRDQDLPGWPGGVPPNKEALDAMYKYPWKEGTGIWGYSLTAAREVDLTKIQIPVLAVIGEYDSPNFRTHRMSRELPNFRKVVLPDLSHRRSYRSKEYREIMLQFIDDNDPGSVPSL